MTVPAIIPGYAGNMSTVFVLQVMPLCATGCKRRYLIILHVLMQGTAARRGRRVGDLAGYIIEDAYALQLSLSPGHLTCTIQKCSIVPIYMNIGREYAVMIGP